MTTRKKSPPDLAGRVALSVLGVSAEHYKVIRDTGDVPAAWLDQPTITHRLAALEAKTQTMEIMLQAMVVLSGVDLAAITETVKKLLAVREKAMQPKEGSKVDAEDDTNQAAQPL